MNTSSLKTFAPAVRKQLMEAVTRKLDFALTAQTPDYLTTFAPQVAALRKLAQTDRAGLIERVAYTWFNRFAALRFMDARGWHPFRARVLTPASAAETQPELLKLTRTGALPEELHRHTNPARLNDLLDGRIPSPDAQGEVYRHLVLAACHFYHALLPNLFEKLDDETELLLPDDLLTEHSVVHGFRTEISDADCGDGQRANVEILGWLYQFYISERKDQVMARKSAVPTEDIPAVTQLFTPHWIVRYLVENSLGRLWLQNRPHSKLSDHMPYYIADAPNASPSPPAAGGEGPGEVGSSPREAQPSFPQLSTLNPQPGEGEFLKITKPEEIRLCDPACGSGHMLTYAFDLLVKIYEEEGYAPTEIPALILRHNLHGLEICPRAAQLAELALVFKAREKSRRFFQPEHLVRPHILELRDVRFDEGELSAYFKALDHQPSTINHQLLQMLHQFEEAKNFGSLIQPCLDERAIASARRAITDHWSLVTDHSPSLFLRETHLKVLRVLEQAEALTQRYHVVVANPPYMGSSKFNDSLKEFTSGQFQEVKADLYSCFLLRNLEFLSNRGFCSMITLPNWMFLGSWEEFRGRLLKEYLFRSLVHCGRGLWGSDFGSCAFVIEKKPSIDAEGRFKRLFDVQGEVNSPEELERRFLDHTSNRTYATNARRMLRIPGQPISYWASEKLTEAFRRGVLLEKLLDARIAMASGDNDRFIRRWFEVSLRRIGFSVRSEQAAIDSNKTWFPCNKGGEYRRWYGNNDVLLHWRNGGEEVRSLTDPATGRVRSHNYNGSFAFQEGLTWSALSASKFGIRFSEPGFMFVTPGSSAFVKDPGTSLKPLLGFLSSQVAEKFLRVISSTMNIEVGNLLRIPYLKASKGVSEVVDAAISLARADWDNFETSWDFRDQPLLRPGLKGATLEASWRNWEAQSTAAIRRMQELETENNRLFIAAYGLDGELQPAVPEAQITLARAEARRDMAAFLSYAVGCMMGRYSPDHPGLILANAGDTLREFLAKVGRPQDQLTFAPDEDGIIPVLDGEWFEDDIVARTRDFLRATFGETTLRENLRFIEDSLGKELRNYFLANFYKDHLQTYKKRPIYWMVQSPRKGFQCLIYLHRSTKDTMNLVLNRYLRDYQVKLRNRLAHLAQVQAAAATAREKTAARKEADKLTKTLHECDEWERQTLLPLAQARIELDLDDGVKTNYLKLGEALAPIAGLAAKEDE